MDGENKGEKSEPQLKQISNYRESAVERERVSDQ